MKRIDYHNSISQSEMEILSSFQGILLENHLNKREVYND